MKKSALPTILLLSLCSTVSFAQDPGDSCTNLIVTRGASATGSVNICYTCDAPFASQLMLIEAADHEPGSIADLADSRGNVSVAQIPHTFAVLASNGIGHINEYQLSIGETTFGGRSGLSNENGLHYADLMTLALQRSRTAREAIETIGQLANEYGYRSPGESISIGDKNEAWLLEIIGTGHDRTGAVWVAVRIPDGHVSCHANQSRIGEFPLNDPENCLYSRDVISFAREMGFSSDEDGPFNFSNAYDPASERKKKTCAMRVWSILRRAAPSLDLSPDYARGVENARRYPLSVRPDAGLDTRAVFGLLRDHYEGTDFDMTTGENAGAFGSPNQRRSERGISTPITSFSIVTQSRSHLPDPVGGVLWYSPDDTYFSCYAPFYCGIDRVPEAYARADREKFSWDSAWWTINFVANFADLHYDRMKTDIQAEQSAIEEGFIGIQSAVETTAVHMLESDPDIACRYLTEYSISCGETVLKRWHQLAERLISRYIR